MELLARRAISLQVQEAALRAEFKDWRARTEERQKLEKHNTQVRRLTDWNIFSQVLEQA
ncbi:MAG: hypothetical protein KF893_23275 [Caldilineaceae bacterium]|nr:hypothetical protein [Caldilineaceae bacterium]